MHQAYLELNGVRTKVVTYGRWVEESSDGREDIVILIPGNPGVIGFYDLFAKIVHERLGYPVWCVGHAGHNFPKEKISPLPKLQGSEKLYGLQGQIQHKVDFFEKYVPNNARVHLVGHSIGCYMILELLQHPSIRDKVDDVYLLFPTIEHMAETDNGKFLTGIIKHIVWLIVFLSWIFTMLPNIVQNIFLYCYMLLRGVPVKQHLNNIKDVVKPGVLKRVFFLAYEEMDQVKERNNQIIKENINKIKLYYGETDGWAPAAFYERIKAEIPDVNAQTCRFNHVFIMKRSVEVGNILADWIKGKQ